MTKPMGLLAILLLLYGTAGSQIVNIESARMQTDTTGLKGDAGAGFSLASNQVRIFQAEAEAHLQYKTPKNLWLALGHYGFLKGSQTRYIDNTMLHLRFNRKLNSWLRWEVFTQWQDNSVTRIKSRYLAGTGPRIKIAGTRHLHLYTAAALMYEYEQESAAPFIKHTGWRGSNYLSFTLHAAKTTEISGTVYYQPLMDNWSDYRIMNQARLRVRTGKHISLRMTWQYLRDRFPAAGAPRETYTFSTGFGYEF